MTLGRSVCVFFLLGGCSCDSRPSIPPADRSDGVIPELSAPFTAEEPTLDGRTDETIWSTTNQTGGFVQPGTGERVPASRVNANAWLAWNESALFVAVRVLDDDASSPFTPSDRDPHVWERASGIELMLQPGNFEDNRHYYEVQVDVAGAQWTTRFDDYMDPVVEGATPADTRFGHQEWDPAISYGASVERGEYTIEFRLPWSSLESDRTGIPPAAGDTWRVNLYSFRDGQRDALAWSPILRQGNFHRSSRFGRVTFVR